MSTSSRGSSPWCQSTSPGLHGPPAQHARELVELRRRPAREERDGGEEVRRSRGQTSRSRVRSASPSAVRSAVRIEYSGTSSHEEKSAVSGSEAMITERAGSAAVISQPPSPSRRTRPPSAYQRLTNGQVGLEHLVLGRVPAVVERDAGRDHGVGRC